MLKLPQSIIFAMIAVNITAFTVLLQLDMLIFHALAAKILAWIFTIGAWALAYRRRKKYFVFF